MAAITERQALIDHMAGPRRCLPAYEESSNSNEGRIRPWRKSVWAGEVRIPPPTHRMTS